MNPNDSQPLPVNYLDQIAPKRPRKTDFLRDKFGKVFIALGILTIIVVVMCLMSALLGNKTNSTVHLAAKLESVSEIAKSATNNLKSSTIKAYNSELNLYLTNTIRDITPILASEEIDFDNLDSKVIRSESNVGILDTLEEARLNGVYDRTYAREISYQLDLMINLMSQISSSSKNEDLVNLIKTIQPDLESIQEEFANYSS